MSDKFENNILNLKFQNEISLQVLAQFEAVGLDREQLRKLQHKLPILYPWNKGYQLYRNNYNRRFTYFPMGIVRCRRTQDVQNALRFVETYKLKFAIRSGAHCYLAFSLSTGIIIDLFEMNTIKIVCNKESRKNATEIRSDKHVILGPGSRLGVVIEKLSPLRLSVPVGSCVNTATGGLSLGGGISPSLIRLGGLMMDHLKAVKMVLANGKLIQVDKDHHPDLFFAVRGAGGSNFGIITEFVFNPCRFNGAVVFTIQYPWSQFRQIMNMWQNFAPFTDRRLSTEMDVYPPKFPPLGELPVQFKGQFEGSLAELKALIHEFIRAALADDTKAAPAEKASAGIYINPIKTFAESGLFWGKTRQSYFESNSIFWQNLLSADALDVYAHHLEKAPGLGSSIEFNAMRGAVEDVSPNATAFPYRKSLFWAQHRGTTLDPQQLPKQQIWVNRLYDAIAPFAEKIDGATPSYINAPQSNLQAHDRFLTAYYSDNLKKLVEIKNKYDPKNVFHFDQSIPLSLKDTDTDTDDNNKSNWFQEIIDSFVPRC